MTGWWYGMLERKVDSEIIDDCSRRKRSMLKSEVSDLI